MGTSVRVPPKFCDQTSFKAFWKDLLTGWLDLVKKYEEEKETNEGGGLKPWRDLSYWHCERPLTGLLAAAAWQIGGWSIEEACIDRTKRCGKQKTGWVDLWLGRGNDASSVEAKILWVEQEDVKAVIDKISRKLRKARNQLRKLQGDCRVGQPVSVCFAVPCFSTADGLDKGRRVLAELEAKAEEERWATVRHETQIAEVKDVKDSCLYPGVLLVAKKVKWQDRP